MAAAFQACESNNAISTLEQTTHAADKSADPEASFGDEEDFHAGLKKMGLPRPKMVDAMLHEFCRANDSTGIYLAPHLSWHTRASMRAA